MIRIRGFVTERGVDFFNDFRRGLSKAVLLRLFSRVLSRVLVWHH